MGEVSLLSIADNPVEAELGLQFVRSMPRDSGMLFDFKYAKHLSFWGKNTYLDLDIAFVDEGGVIVKTESIIPMSLRPVRCDKPCVMALEVPKGGLELAGAKVGSRMVVDRKNKKVRFE